MSTAISPDGRYVAYTAQETNWTDNEFVQQIWIAASATGETYKLTNGTKSSQSPKWSPDGKRLAFRSDRDGKNQIYVISMTGGEAAKLTAEESGVGYFDWSPDGSSIAFVSSGPESQPKKDRKEKYGDFELFRGDYTMMHLWLVQAPADIPSDPKQRPKPQALTEGRNFSVTDFEWSPDGKKIAFAATRDPDLGSFDTAQIYVVDVADRHARRLLQTEGPHSEPIWSPDGRQIAFTTANGNKFFFYTNPKIAIVPADGGTGRVVTTEFDEIPRLLSWAAEGIYFTALHKTASHLYRLNPESGEAKQISVPEALHSFAVSFSRDHHTVAAIGGPPNRFTEVFVSSAVDFVPKYLTHFNDDWKPFRLGTREVIQWKSKDGTIIEGVLIKPADYNASQRYPLLVVIHGGPTGIDLPILSPDRYYPVERFVAKGALVLRPNYRGSAGYGEKFRSLNVRNLGLGDYDDVITGVDYLIQKGMVDKDRVGAMGWSQGGYIWTCPQF